MNAWSPHLARTIAFSLSEVIDAAPATRSWIEGFLAGSEPDAVEMFGPTMREAEDDDVRWRRWETATAEFRATGAWPCEPWQELRPLPRDVAAPGFPWAVRADEVLVWVDASQQWEVADPQPPRLNGLLMNSLCFDRGHHEFQDIAPDIEMCHDCGATRFF